MLAHFTVESTYRRDVSLRFSYVVLPRLGEGISIAARADLVYKDATGRMSIIWQFAEDHELCTWDGKSDDGPQGEIGFPLDSYDYVVFHPSDEQEVKQVVREWLHPNFSRLAVSHISHDGTWCKRIDWDPSAMFEYAFC